MKSQLVLSNQEFTTSTLNLNIEHVGPGLGPGQTVVVEGDPIMKPIPYTNIAYQSIIIAVGYVITFATRPWQVI